MMTSAQFIELVSLVSKLRTLGDDASESWGFLNISGPYDFSVFENLKAISTLLNTVAFGNCVRIQFDTERVVLDDFPGYEKKSNSFKRWSTDFNKEVLLGTKIEGYFYNFFLKEDECEKWIAAGNPLGEDNKINLFSPLRLIVEDLKNPFGSDLLWCSPIKHISESKQYVHNEYFPTAAQIKENVHFVTTDTVQFNPLTFYIRKYDHDSILSKTLVRHSSLVMSVCLVNEYYSNDKIILDGIKRTVLRITEPSDKSDVATNQLLKNIVAWEYQDKVATRKKLFNDRLTLETHVDQSFIASLAKNAPHALEQAKERYNFVILERKDAYLKELKELLKDLRTQSDLYSLKVRGLLNNFLRDALAAILLIGFTLFTKFSENMGLEKQGLLKKVFYGLAVYYMISVVFQTVTDWTDISVTERELRYWKSASKELIPNAEFDKHYKKTLGIRSIWSYVLYSVIAFLYILIIISCFLYPYLFKELIV